MNKCKILFAIIFAFLFVEFTNAENGATNYYKAGCKALDKGKIEKAEEKFLKAIKVSIENVKKANEKLDDFAIRLGFFQDSECFEYDVCKAMEMIPKNDWRVYYYKGLLEANIIYCHKSGGYIFGFIDNVSEELAITTLKKSISLYDNYQSHIVLAYLEGGDERTKAIQLATAIGCNEAAGNMEYGLGVIHENSGNLEKALAHYNKSLEYFWKSETDFKIQKLSHAIGIMPKDTRQTWENLRKFLTMGNYTSYIPFEKGDKISIPQYLISIVDIDFINGNYSYLFTATGITEISQYAYLITKRQLSSIADSGANLVMEPVVIQCTGTASYKRGLSIVDTYVFTLVE